MKRNKTRRSSRAKRLLLLSLSIGFIGFGLWFSSTNAATFLKGYLLFKTSQADADTAVKPEVVLSEEKEQEQKQEAEPEKTEKKEAVYLEQPEQGENIGELIIPKLDAALPIIHGTDEEELEKGVGHFAESVLPGMNDNSVLSGHRDTVFRRLGEVGKGDLLIVETVAGKFTYKVRQVRIVDEDDRTVIVPKPRATLTVSTCYPFDFVGYAPERYILVADLISSE